MNTETRKQINNEEDYEGILKVTFDKDGDPKMEMLTGISIQNIAEYIASGLIGGAPVATMLYQAGIIAQALVVAKEVKKKFKEQRKLDEIERRLEEVEEHALYGEEDGDE